MLSMVANFLIPVAHVLIEFRVEADIVKNWYQSGPKPLDITVM